MNELEAKCYLTKKGGANNSDHTCMITSAYLCGAQPLQYSTYATTVTCNRAFTCRVRSQATQRDPTSFYIQTELVALEIYSK